MPEPNGNSWLSRLIAPVKNWFSNLGSVISDSFRQGGFNSGSFQDSFFGKLISGLLGGYTGSNLTPAEREANEFTTSERVAAQDWTAQMENTRYQRQVADMQAAGLNPMMAASGSPSSAQSSGGSSVSPAAPNLSALFQLALIKPQMELMRAQAKNLNASANEKDVKSGYWEQRKKESEAKIALMQNQAERELAQAMLSRANEENVRMMQPELIKLYKAQSAHESASATLAAAQAAYQNGLITEGMCKAVVAKIVAERNLASANASKADIEASVEKLAVGLQTGSYPSVVKELVEKYHWDKDTYYTVLAHLKNSFDAIPLSVTVGS